MLKSVLAVSWLFQLRSPSSFCYRCQAVLPPPEVSKLVHQSDRSLVNEAGLNSMILFLSITMLTRCFFSFLSTQALTLPMCWGKAKLKELQHAAIIEGAQQQQVMTFGCPAFKGL